MLLQKISKHDVRKIRQLNKSSSSPLINLTSPIRIFKTSIERYNGYFKSQTCKCNKSQGCFLFQVQESKLVTIFLQLYRSPFSHIFIPSSKIQNSPFSHICIEYKFLTFSAQFQECKMVMIFQHLYRSHISNVYIPS